MRFEEITAVNINITILWNVTPYILVDGSLVGILTFRKNLLPPFSGFENTWFTMEIYQRTIFLS
jgi:hypothetical protein